MSEAKPTTVPRPARCVRKCSPHPPRFRTATAPPNPSAIRATAAPAMAGRPHPLPPIPPASWPACDPSSRDAERGSTAPGGSAPWRSRANSRANRTAPAPHRRGALHRAARSTAFGSSAAETANPAPSPFAASSALSSAHCVPRLAMVAPLSSPLYPLREKGAGRTNERGRGASVPPCPPTQLVCADAQRASGEGKKKAFSLRIVCVRALFTTPPQSKKLRSFASREKEGSGAPKGALSNQCPRQARLRAAVLAARRLSALTLAAFATGFYPDGSAPEPGFPRL